MTYEIGRQNPYVGPRPFERSDGRLFFGREREASDLFSLTIAHRTLLIYAQSGAGKTSLINAKLIPKLEEDGFNVFPIARLQGSVDPIGVSKKIKNIFIYNTLMSIVGKEFDPKRFADLTLSGFLDEKRKSAAPDESHSPQVIIFDQFEEIFNLYMDRWEDRKGFFIQIRDEIERTDGFGSQEAVPPSWLIFVMREDYIAQLDPYLPILPGKLRTRYRLERLQADAALQAVTEPLKNTQRSFADGVSEKLVEELLKIRVETIPGESREIRGEFVEPVQLQLVCQSLWQELPDDVKEITESHLSAFGNVDQVLSRFYDKAIQLAAEKAFVEQKRLRTWFEDVLITSMGTRGTVYRSPKSTAGIPNAAIDALENQHLIRAEYRAGARWYELTHDRFIGPIRASNKAFQAQIIGQPDEEDIRHKALSAITQGEQAWGMGNFQESLDAYQKAGELYASIGDQWGVASMAIYTGLIFSQMEDHSAAIDHYNRALEIFEEIGDQWNIIITLTNMAGAYKALGDQQKASQLLQQADVILRGLGKSSETANIIARLGYAYFELEDYNRAIELFTEVIQLQPKNAEWYGGRAAVYWYWGRYPEAIDDFSVEINLDPDSFSAYNGRGQVLAEQGVELKKAVDDLKKAIKLGGEDTIGTSYARNGLGLAYGQLGKYDLAFKEFDVSIKESPQNGWVYYNRAMIYELMEKQDEAIQDYRQALQMMAPPLNAFKREKAQERLRELGAGVP